MSLTHPKLRTSDRDYAIREANRLAYETGIRHRVVIEHPDVPAKGIAFLVDEAVPTRKHLEHGLRLDKHLAQMQERINTALERVAKRMEAIAFVRQAPTVAQDGIGLADSLNRAFNTPGRW